MYLKKERETETERKGEGDRHKPQRSLQLCLPLFLNLLFPVLSGCAAALNFNEELEILPILNSSLSHFITLPVSINHRKILHGCKGFFADTTDSVDWLTDVS
ncbi:hypothetical protein ILYODFUR_028675 [Ilyodon furcidens]|uniref:Uncharacterized protein n=1 Tax=Ilyodon furcidens TaxID=33524 RepID=A0ABV0U0A4_9TELE